jgi:T5SS/PEP-CTERM-associated repeat protein
VKGKALVVTNGGRMTTSQLIIGLQNGANNNQAIVTGTNSLVTASANFSVGELGSGNSLLISKGGQVTNFLVGYAGRQGQNNRVTVTDPGSVWFNGASVLVGANLGNNTLEIANGATVAGAGSVLCPGERSEPN